ncbi:ABC transporter permease [Algivirga pacifica]|uniref:ABC3 transporter permease C-terminal domain-containing protein n=1 Tax=Algivirga pacifica TaxID=1162670 RepID=A0ABP9DKU7_9BACT
MIKHSFKLIWAKKGKNTMMLLQLAFSFFMLFLLFTLLYDQIENYQRERGYTVDNIMVLNVDGSKLAGIENYHQEIQKNYESIDHYLSSLSEVESFSDMDDSFPFGSSYNSESFELENGQRVQYIRQILNPTVIQLMEVKFISGRNFNASDFDNDKKARIVNDILYEKIKPFLNDKKELLNTDGTVRMRIVGVIEGYKKQHEFEEAGDVCFWPHNKEVYRQGYLFIKTKNDPRILEAQLVQELEKRCPDLSFNIQYWDDLMDGANQSIILPLVLMSVVCLFLVINIALGLYGILWYNISLRTSEIGLRRALGASRGDISKQILIEVGALCVLSILLGGIFAIQFPLLGVFNFTNEEYLIGALLSCGFVGMIAFLCGWYPSKLASAITPTEALQEL